jgi:hypothetical protein
VSKRRARLCRLLDEGLRVLSTLHALNMAALDLSPSNLLLIQGKKYDDFDIRVCAAGCSILPRPVTFFDQQITSASTVHL